MKRVENGEALWMLTGGFMEINRGRNRIAVLAVLLTCLLFTSLFAGTASMFFSRIQGEKYQYQTYSCATASFTDRQQADLAAQVIEDCPFIEKWGQGVSVSQAADPWIHSRLEVMYGDEALAENYGSLPTKGRMPEKPGEIALGTQALWELGISPGLSARVTLTLSGQEETFFVCGYWKGREEDLVQRGWICREDAMRLLSLEGREGALEEERQNGGNTESVRPAEAEAGEVKPENAGKEAVISMAVWYDLPLLSLYRTELLNERLASAGLPQAFVVSYAYDQIFGEGGISLPALALITLLIMLSGYLIIYNIFDISARKDLYIYGLLKNVGTTGRQLRQIMRRQVLLLCLMGLPGGLLLGYGVGIWMVPFLTAQLDVNSQVPRVVEGAVFPVLLFSALFTMVTVYLSSRSSYRRAEKMWPAEAMKRWEDGRLRSFKTGLLVVCSVALGLITVNCAVIMALGYDLEEYRSIYLASDFQLDGFSELSTYADLAPVTREVKDCLDICPYSEDPGYIYYSQVESKLDLAQIQAWEEIVAINESEWGKYWSDRWEAVKENGRLPVAYMGINRAAFEKLEWRGEPCSWEVFSTGDYALVNYPGYIRIAGNKFHFPRGECVSLELKKGTKSYQIPGEAALPYSMDYQYTNLIGIQVLVPEMEFIQQTGIRSAMAAALDAKDGQEQALEEYLTWLTEAESGLKLSSVLTLEKNFRQYTGKYYQIGGYLALILGFIGVMNFSNTIAAFVVSHRRQLAVLEAVGMTRRQLLLSLMGRGCLYLLTGFLLSAVFTKGYAVPLLKKTLGSAFFFHGKAVLWPSALMLLFLGAVTFLIAWHYVRKLRKSSVAERIRQE